MNEITCDKMVVQIIIITESAFYLIAIEFLGEGMRSGQTIEESEELSRRQKMIHSLLLLLSQNRRANGTQHFSWIQRQPR